MDSKNLNLNLTQDEQLIEVKKKYQKLRTEIRTWQQEKGLNGLEGLRPDKFSPYFTLDSLPEEQVLELWQRLNQASGETTDIVELYNFWTEFKSGKIGDNHSLFSRLHLAISGAAQLGCQQLQLSLEEEDQPIGPCPVCGADKFMATLVPPVGKRYLHCLVCNYKRPVMSSGCARCGSEEASKQTYLNSEDFPGIEMAACLDCGSYFKQLDLRELNVEDLVWEDIRSLPLNYAAEQWLAEQGGKEAETLN